MKAAFAARVNLVTKAAEVANFSCWSKKLRFVTEAHKKSLACSALKGASQHLNKVIMENSCVFPYLLPFLVGIGLDHNLHIFCNNLHFKRLQTVRSVASSSKFYRLLPDKENTANPQILVGALLKIESKGFIFCWHL